MNMWVGVMLTNRVIREDLSEKMTHEQSLERGKGVSNGAIW